MTILMANSVGFADDFECVGKSAVWNNKGEIIVQLDNKNQGIIFYDNETKHFKVHIFQ
jgi:predicted amidohydrolase